MAKLLISESILSGIADAIRGRNGAEVTYLPGEMAGAIADIQIGTGFEAMAPEAVDVTGGYVASGGWNVGSDPAYADVYAVRQGHTYLIRLGGSVGNRFRVMFSTTSPAGATARISGTRVGDDKNDPAQYEYKPLYAPGSDGYVTIGKTSVGQTGVETFVYDVTGIMG